MRGRFNRVFCRLNLAKVGGISIFARYIPCSELAGDFYDYAPFHRMEPSSS